MGEAGGAEVAAGDSTREGECIVVGSGFGGAVTACRLAQAGYRVTVVERGRRYEAGDFPALPAKGQLLPELRRWAWSSDQGIWDVLDLGDVVSVQAAGYGGGSLLYANVHMRPPVTAFDARWPRVYRPRSDGTHELDEYFDLVGYMLDAAPIGEHPTLGRPPKTAGLERVMRDLGRGGEHFQPLLAISRETGVNPHGVPMNACTGCGQCCTGCPERAKNTLDTNYLAVAERHGAVVRTQCEVLDVEQLRNGSWRLRCLDHLAATELVLEAPHVFLCAGSVHSTRLLARAKVVDPAEQHRLEAVVGVGYFPGGDAFGVVYDTTEALEPSRGPTITSTTVVRNDERGDSYFLLQDGGYAREQERMLGLLRAPVWLGRNRVTRSSGASVRGRPRAPSRPPSRDARELMPSPVDAVLDALPTPSAAAAVPEQLRERLPALLTEVSRSFLLPEVVGRTIDVSLEDMVKRRLLLRWLDLRFWPIPHLRRATLWLVRWAIRMAAGGDDAIAERAVRALLTASNLPREEVASRLFGYDDDGAEHRLMLLCMGRDAAAGTLVYDHSEGRIFADLRLDALAPGYGRQERLMADVAGALGGELRTSPAWAYLGKPITVHNQGGCPMSDQKEHGVTDADGCVHGCPGLHVFDGAALSSAVGVNPSATIAALAERNVRSFIARHGAPGAGWLPGEQELRERATRWRERAGSWALSPPGFPRVPGGGVARTAAPGAAPVGLKLPELMQGHGVETREVLGTSPADDQRYRDLETAGRPAEWIGTTFDLVAADLAAFLEDSLHRMTVTGSVELPGAWLGRAEARVRLAASGELQLLTDPAAESRDRRDTAEHLRARRFRLGDARALRPEPPPGRPERLMRYRLDLTGAPGFKLEGYKRIRNDPGLDAWRDTTTLFWCLVHEDPRGLREYRAGGALHVALNDFVTQQLGRLEVTGTDDPARIAWATATFATFFFGSLQRVYSPAVGSALRTFFGVTP